MEEEASISDVMEDDVEAPIAQKTTSEKMKSCLLYTLRMFRSVLGLGIVLLLYTFLGGFIIMEFEAPHENLKHIQVRTRYGH